MSAWVAPTLGIAAGLSAMIGVTLWVAASAPSAPAALQTALATGGVVAAATAVLTTLVWHSAVDRPPGRLSVSVRGALARMRRGFVTGVTAVALLGVPVLAVTAAAVSLVGGWTVAAVEAYTLGLSGAVALAMVVGLALGVHRWLQAEPERSARTGPGRLIRDDRRSSLGGAAAAGVVVGAVTAVGLVVGVSGGALLVQAVTGWTGWPGVFDPGSLVDARRFDVTRRHFSSTWLMVGALVVLPGVLFAWLTALTGAWTRFTVTRAVLATRGLLPWRLLRFLADARDREVLREIGGVYQFRHIRLQERLASTHDQPMPAPPRPARLRRRILAAAVAVGAFIVATPVLALPDVDPSLTLRGGYATGSYRMTFNRTGSRIALSSDHDRTVRIFALPSGRLEQKLGPFAGFVDTVVWSPDGSMLAVRSGKQTTTTGDDTVSVINAYTGALRGRFQLLGRDPGLVTFDPTGQSVLVQFGDSTVNNWLSGDLQLWRVDRGELRTFSAAEGFSSIELSPDHRVVSTERAAERVLRGSVDGEAFPALSPTPDLPSSVGAHLAVNRGTDVVILDPATGEILATRTGSWSDTATGVSYWPTFVVADDRSAAAWDPSRRAFRAPAPFVAGDFVAGTPGEVVIGVSADARFLAITGLDRLDVRIWDSETRREMVPPEPFPRQVSAATFSPDGRSVLIGGLATSEIPTSTDEVRWIDLGTGAVIMRTIGDLQTIKFSPDGHTVAGIDQTGVRMWRGSPGGPSTTVTLAGSSEFGAMRFTPDGSTLALVENDDGSTADVRLYRIHDGSEWRRFRVHSDAFTLSAELLAVGTAVPVLAGRDLDGRVRILDYRAQKTRRVCVGHSGPIRQVAFTPDERFLATSGEDGTVRFWPVPA